MILLVKVEVVEVKDGVTIDRKPRSRNFKDITGQKFGRLTVIELDYIERKNRQSNVYWKCLCDCGNIASIRYANLSVHGTSSCGCIQKEHALYLLKKHNLIDKPFINSTKDHTIDTIYRNYNYGAKRRNLPFDLNLEEFKQFIFSNCHYCDVAPKNSYNPYIGKDGNLKPSKTRKSMIDRLEILKTLTVEYNGIDRKDSNQGYLLDNCVSCCKECNELKSNRFTYEEFMLLVPILRVIINSRK